MNCWCGGEVVAFTTADSPPPKRGVCAASEYHDPFATGRPERVEHLYIAGPMSGYDQCNYPEFIRVAAELRAKGFTVCNPAEFGGKGSHYVDLCRDDLRGLLDCHGVALLDNWHESAGARIEALVAGHLMMPVKPYREWLV